MPIPKLVQLTSWSYSRFSDYVKCPAMAKYKHIDRIKEPGNAAMDRGTAIHLECEKYVKGELKKLPESMARFPKEFAALRKLGTVLCEQSWSFTKAWEEPCSPTDWNRAWVRIKVDAHWLVVKKVGKVNQTTVHIVDYKSGKESDDHRLQRDLYALGAFHTYTDAVAVVAEHWYLDQGTIAGDKVLYTRTGDMAKLQQQWDNATHSMLNDKRFATQPGKQCGWCFYSKNKHGDCKF